LVGTAGFAVAISVGPDVAGDVSAGNVATEVFGAAGAGARCEGSGGTGTAGGCCAASFWTGATDDGTTGALVAAGVGVMLDADACIAGAVGAAALGEGCDAGLAARVDASNVVAGRWTGVVPTAAVAAGAAGATANAVPALVGRLDTLAPPVAAS
jgi:hypothetical protein